MKKIGVLGTGTMGAGIIQVLAQNGYEVVMRARRQSSIDKGMATVEKNMSIRNQPRIRVLALLQAPSC